MTRKPDIDVVLFDLGGVLVELTGTDTLMSWTGGRHPPASLWDFWLTSPAVRAFESGRLEPRDFADQLIAELDLPIAIEAFIEAFTYWPKALFSGALELVGDVRPSTVRATLSNTNALHWPRLMREMALETAFDHHFPSHLTGNVKPDSTAFEGVMQRMGWQAESVLFIDDNEMNVTAASSLGIQAYRVRGVSEAREVLAGAGVLG